MILGPEFSMRYTVLILLFLVPGMWLGHALSNSELVNQHQRRGLVGRIFGETREILGTQMIQRADLYFHGGVGKIECHHGLSDSAGHHSEVSHGHTHDHSHKHDHDEDTPGYIHQDGRKHSPTHTNRSADWLTRLNRSIHPRAHKHLSGANAEKELLPWLWAAVKADPHNIEAYNIGSYWLGDRLNRPEEALEFIRHGIRDNPNAYELEISRAELLWHNVSDRNAAVAAFHTARKKFHAQFQPGAKTPIKNIPSADKLRYHRILSYLTAQAVATAHTAQAIAYLREAIPYANNPEHLRQRIKKLQ